MPRILSEKAEIEFKAKIKRRRIYAAEKILDALPGPSEDPMPKDRVFDKATKLAQANGLAEEPYFDGNPKRFRQFLGCQWPSIRAVGRDDCGFCVEYGHGLAGIRRAGKRGAAKTNEWQAKCTESCVASLNAEADAMNKLLDVEAYHVQMKLLFDGKRG